MPQRFLRPGITTSVRFNAVDWQCQTFYVRLLTLVDDFGRYEGDVRILRSHVFPLGDYKGGDISLKTIENICAQLSANELVIFYETPDSKKVMQVLRWQERARAQVSRYPEFLEDCKQMFTERRIIPQNPASIAPRSSPSPSPLPLYPRSSFIVPSTASAVLRDKFEKWMDVRKGLGKKPKDWNAMFSEQFTWLEQFPEAEQIEILSQSMRNGWQGLFELKERRNGNHAKPEPMKKGTNVW